MNFFEHQHQARQSTARLIFLFGIGVVLILVAVNAVVLFCLGGPESLPKGAASSVCMWTTAVTALVIFFGTLTGILQMSGGGTAIARKLGGRPILPDTTQPDERRLQNVVEEMAIASGVMVPRIFVFEGDEINAFAAGDKPDNAVLAVSRGVLKKLNRDELQAVVAHEFSHIFNGDMRMSLRLIGVLNGILMIAIVGRILLRTRGKKNPLPLLGLALIVIGYLGVFMSRIIKSAVSHQRELLADASAVQFTRNPSSLVSALDKIRTGSSFVAHPNAEEVSHLFFAQGFRSMFDGLFATHPPLAERIHAIDPSFKFDGSRERTPSSPVTETAGVAAFASTRRVAVTPEAVTNAVASPTRNDMDAAVAFHHAIPAEILAQLKTADGAAGVVYALLFNEHPMVRDRQRALLITDTERSNADRAFAALAKADLHLRLPVLELTIGGLRLLSTSLRIDFLRRVAALTRSDNRITPFEFAADVILQKCLVPDLDPSDGPPGDVRSDGLCLLSYLAYAGSPAGGSAAEKAFSVGVRFLMISERKVISAWDQCGPDAARLSLKRLSLAKPLEKERVVQALAACVSADGTVTPGEWEILRTFCQCLGCPTPLLPPS